MATPRKRAKPKGQQVPMSVTNIIKISVVIWTAVLLTAYYGRVLPQMDATFIAGLLTQTLGSLGLEVMKKGKDEENKTPPQQAPTIPNPNGTQTSSSSTN